MAVSTTSQARASRGGAPALACLEAFEQQLDYLCRTLRRQGVPPADVEDLAHDVFLVMWRRWAEYDQERPVRPWLGAIACHLAIKHLSRHRREVQRADADRLDDTPLPDDRLASARARALALRALAALPDRHRMALTLHELDGISVRDLASLWSVPLFTAYTRLRAARRAFSQVVARLQPQRPRGAAALLSARAALAPEKAALPAPADVRARIQDRARALVLGASAEGPLPGVDDASAVPSGAPAVSAVVSRSGKLAAAPLSTLLLGTVAAVAILSVSISRSRREGGPAAARPGAVLPVRAAHPPSGAVLHASGTAPPRLVAAVLPEDTRDLLGRWSFDDGAGSSVARDSSGQGRHCLVRGPGAGSGWIQGARGGALNVGAGAWLECPLPDQADLPTSELTVTAWIAPGRTRAGVYTIASRARVRGHGEHFVFGLRSGRLRFYSTPWDVEIDHPLPRKADPWMHVAFTQGQDGLVRLYLDGLEVARTKMNRRFSAQFIGPLRVGAGTFSARAPSLTAAPQPFRGSLDEVRIYQRALANKEIAALAGGNFP
jgi:RNA polymerase sigma factor (sigma-70 family)